MSINKLTLEELRIPFNQIFSHASATRDTTTAILVKAQSANGSVGHGEGCPRNYVTGETIQTTREFFNCHQNSLVVLEQLDQLKEWIVKNKESIDQNPAAWCAIELALLDMFAKESQQSIEACLSLPELSGTFQYTAVLGSNCFNTYKKTLEQYIEAGFTDYKIKVSGNLVEDKPKIDSLKTLEDDIRVRLDANNLWQSPNEARKYIKALDYSFFAIEEPLKAKSYNSCREISDALNIPIILDESFLRVDQFNDIAKDPHTWIVNLRISKMGGILRSLAIAQQAKKHNIPLIIGAQVGETSILTRAAISIANAFQDILLAQEGAFGTHLLEHDITKKSIMFGKLGILRADSISNTLS